MRVTVTLFARLRELAGRESLAVDVPEGATVADVWTAVGAACPGVAPFGASVSSAVNAEFARRHTVVREGDDVAFLPPVSGGAQT
ncbi:MAG: MoaD/ThiS family protein [Vicinamibacterales bacterium]